ncbi:Gluconolactonase [Sphingomonas antarctica]
MKHLTALLCGILTAATASAAPPPTRFHMASPVAGVGDGGWDYATVEDGEAFVAHSDAVTVFDLAHGTSRKIGHVARAHAALPIAGTHWLLVTSGGDASVRILDRRSGVEAARIAVGANPDAAIFDAQTGHVLVMNAEAGTVSEVDIVRRLVVRTITLQSGLEFAAIGRGRIMYVNNEDANTIDRVDLGSGRVESPIAMPGCEGPSGLAYDARSNRLIAACANGKAAIIDAGAGRLAQLVDIGHGPDAVILDARRRLAFIPCGRDGVLEILSLGDAGVVRVATVVTEVGARTGALDAKTGTLYLPTAKLGAPPAPGKRAPIQPGTFHLVVVRSS